MTHKMHITNGDNSLEGREVSVEMGSFILTKGMLITPTIHNCVFHLRKKTSMTYERAPFTCEKGIFIYGKDVFHLRKRMITTYDRAPFICGEGIFHLREGHRFSKLFKDSIRSCGDPANFITSSQVFV